MTFTVFFSPSCIGSGGKEQGEVDEDCHDDDLSDADGDDDEDESDLDMAWKMLDIARAITEKQSTDTMVKVDILCALAEISLERGISYIFLVLPMLFFISSFHFSLLRLVDFLSCFICRGY